MKVSSTTKIRLGTLIVVWALWEAVSVSGLVFKGVVPSSVDVLRAVARYVSDASFYGHLWRTVYEVAVGFALGTLAGLTLGIVMGMSRFLGRVFDPYLNILAPTPKIVFLPVLMILFGVDAGSKMAMGGISAFFPVAMSAYAGMQLVSPVLLKVARGFQASSSQLVSKVYLPSMLEPLATGMRLGLGVAIIGTLLAEIKLSNKGLGYLAIQEYNAFHIADMYAILLLTFAVAVAANALIGRATRQFTRR
jgi:ABC-type nitrate/sulfonate/bicarbonate transport system permease component